MVQEPFPSCTYCGAMIRRGKRFCRNCGQPIALSESFISLSLPIHPSQTVLNSSPPEQQLETEIIPEDQPLPSGTGHPLSRRLRSPLPHLKRKQFFLLLCLIGIIFALTTSLGWTLWLTLQKVSDVSVQSNMQVKEQPSQTQPTVTDTKTITLQRPFSYAGLDWILTTVSLHPKTSTSWELTVVLTVRNSLTQVVIPGSAFNYAHLQSGASTFNLQNSTIPVSFEPATTTRGTMTFLVSQGNASYRLHFASSTPQIDGFHTVEIDFNCCIAA
ncbi:zinc ribbon domain-containing protein [Tengunoibacter tsumagoiensis]|uniref:zinc ribbon domain-containing protein n=1 Tax=Tengunoibacter tsumagoiensis TaxID=2014871 RepID=UPI000F84AD73|nr:zinc ribbon domain-containing protein [Tengunoibacter tsumagoiensis]